MYSSYFHQILKKFEFSQQILQKYLNISFMKILPVEAELFRADGQKDGHFKPNSCFSEFYERA